MEAQTVIQQTRRWIDSFVIGLNLCPFAKKVVLQNRIRYVVSTATETNALLAELTHEMRTLAAAPAAELETTLLIHPQVLSEFLDYNDFLAVADQRLAELKLAGVLQIASFHPRYQFAGTNRDAVENYTNRSPYPMLHLLREESISEAAATYPDLEAIPDRNIQTLRDLGKKAILARLKQVTDS